MSLCRRYGFAIGCGEIFLSREAPIAARLSEAERIELEARRAKLALELKLIEGELRSDAVLRVAGGRPAVALSRRSEYLRKLYGRR